MVPNIVPRSEKINPFLVEESASWHVSSEESRMVGQPASKLGFCLVINRMIPGHLSLLRLATSGKMKLESSKSHLGFTLLSLLYFI